MRSYNLAREFIRHGHQVFVSTTSNRNKMEQELMPDLGEHIFESGTWDYRSIMPGNQSSGGKKTYYEGGIKKWIGKLLNSFPINLIIGEGGALYILNSYNRTKKLVETENIDLVISSFRPYSDHYIAHRLKSRFPELVWIADFRDPHVDPLYKNTVCNGFQHWCNRRILAYADLVTAVSGGIADLFKRYNKKTYRLTNGFSIEHNRRISESGSDKFKIGYTGSMFADERRPDLLLQAISELIKTGEIPVEKIEIIYAGPHAAYWDVLIRQYDLNAVFRDMGNISMMEARNVQSENHINLLLTSSHEKVKGIFTGKLFEYLAAANPIITIINGPEDEEYEELIREINAGLVVYHNSNTMAIKNFILNKFSNWNNSGKLDHHMNMEGLNRYSWPAIFEDFYNYLKKEKLIREN